MSAGCVWGAKIRSAPRESRDLQVGRQFGTPQADVPALGGDRVGEHPADPEHRQQQRDIAVVGAEPPQLAFATCDLAVEFVDQPQAVKRAKTQIPP
jgi:hypothetical protein